MFRFAQQTSIGRLCVETDWPALVYFLRARRHPNPPFEYRDVTVSVNLGSMTDAEALWLKGNPAPNKNPRVVRVADSVFEIGRERIMGIVPRESVHKGVVLEWLWYALAVCCAPDGWEAVHSSAVERDGKGVLFAGGSSSGKTTRAIRAMEGSGARFLSDDIVLVNGSGQARGWDTSLHVQPEQARGLGVESPMLDFAGKMRVLPTAIAEQQEYPISETLGELTSHAGEGFDSDWIPRRAGFDGLRVLFLNRDCRGWFGGDMVHTMAYVRGLQAAGVRAAYYPLEYDDFDSWDVVDVMHAQYGWVRPAVERIVAAGKAFIVSAITHGAPSREELAPVIEPAAAVLCYSESERAFYLERFPDEPPEKFIIVPMGVPEALYAPHSVTPRRSVFSATCYDESKRTLSILRACMELNVPVTFCGPMDRLESQDYFAEMREVAGDWTGVRFFGLLHGETLYRQFREAHVYVDNAGMEPCGLSSLNAFAAGCCVVHTQNSWMAEDFRRYGTLCDPDDTESLVAAIRGELAKPRGWHEYRPMTWNEAVRALLPVYAEVMRT